MHSHLQRLTVIDIGMEIAKRAGILARTRTNKRHRADLIIAATALEYGFILITQNKTDFTRIPGLKVRGVS